MTNHQVPQELYDAIFAEVNDYLGGTMHVVEPPLLDQEHYIESLTDDEYEKDWPFHLDFYGHPIDDEELSTWDDRDQHEAA